MPIQRVSRRQLAEHFQGAKIGFLGRSSFEARSFTAYEQLSRNATDKVSFVASSTESERAKVIREQQGIPDRLLSLVDVADPLQCQAQLAKVVSGFEDLDDGSKLIVDCTTFRREELLVLLRELSLCSARLKRRTFFVYSSASKMGSWLSSNVRELRPVIGFPGDVRPSRNTHLILLAGIEHHRAKAAIEAFEPVGISLGTVPRDVSVTDEIHSRNLELRNYLMTHYDNVVHEFGFSAVDPFSVIDALKDIELQYRDFNVIIAPFNTKLSTLGAGAFALRTNAVQLCYAEVEVYNVLNYSEPGELVYVVALAELLESTPLDGQSE